MLLYEYRIRDDFDRVRHLATRVKEKFERGADCHDLLADRDILEHAFERLLKALPATVTRGSSVKRHLNFMKYYLEHGEPDRAHGDIEELSGSDLDALEESFKQWLSKREHYDPEFATRIGDLIYDQRLGDAIRASFVLLTDRLRAVFRAPGNVDGRDLVNMIFGRNGLAAPALEQGEREAMRALLDGLYGIHRNRHAHADASVEWYEADATLSMVNWALMWLQQYQARPRRRA